MHLPSWTKQLRATNLILIALIILTDVWMSSYYLEPLGRLTSWAIHNIWIPMLISSAIWLVVIALNLRRWYIPAFILQFFTAPSYLLGGLFQSIYVMFEKKLFTPFYMRGNFLDFFSILQLAVSLILALVSLRIYLSARSQPPTTNSTARTL